MKMLATLVLLAALPMPATQNHGRRAGTLPNTSANTSQNSCSPCPPPPAVVATFLGFTDAQTAQFLSLESQFQSAFASVQEQIAALQQQLEMLLSQPSPDPGAIGLVTLQIHAHEQQAAKIVEAYQGQFAALLTMEQQQKIQAVTLASQIQPVVGAFVSLYLVPAPPPPPPCPGH